MRGKLADGDAKLTDLSERMKEARKRKQTLEAEVAGLISKLEF